MYIYIYIYKYVAVWFRFMLMSGHCHCQPSAYILAIGLRGLCRSLSWVCLVIRRLPFIFVTGYHNLPTHPHYDGPSMAYHLGRYR